MATRIGTPLVVLDHATESATQVIADQWVVRAVCATRHPVGREAALQSTTSLDRSVSVPWILIATAILRRRSTLGNIAHGDFATMRVWTVAPSREWKRPVGALTLAALWFVRSGGSLDTNQRTSPDAILAEMAASGSRARS